MAFLILEVSSMERKSWDDLGELQRAVLEGSKELRHSLEDQAAQLGIDAKLVDQFLAEHRGIIVGRLETIYTDRIFEDDDPGSLD